MNAREFLGDVQRAVEAELDRLVPADAPHAAQTLHRAMRYSLFAGGKRIRPVLCIEAARAVDPGVPGAVTPACALELIHTYSLIHDDLPALDNDDFRRGKPTCHKVFGEAMAILAGDALLTLAFRVLSAHTDAPADRTARMVAELSEAAGTPSGMIAGQVADVEGEGKNPDAALLETIHRAKTGALLRASLRLGALYAGAGAAEYAAVSQFGEHVGLAFQIVDDILDVEQTSEALGKTAGKDAQQKKITFPSVYGLDRSHEMATEQRRLAGESLAGFGGRAARLLALADLIVERRA